MLCVCIFTAETANVFKMQNFQCHKIQRSHHAHLWQIDHKPIKTWYLSSSEDLRSKCMKMVSIKRDKIIFEEAL